MRHGVRLPRRGAAAPAASSTAVPCGFDIETLQDNERAPARPDPPEGPRPNRVALFFATAAGAGYSPIAPGTAGSAVAVVLFPLLARMGLGLFLLTTVATLSLGIWAADEAERVYAQKDDGRIVIDEVVGQWLTLAPLIVFGGIASVGLLVTGFVVFRCLDIWKPGPVRWAEQHFQGGTGVMMDDVLAGLFGAVVMAPLAWVLA